VKLHLNSCWAMSLLIFPSKHPIDYRGRELIGLTKIPRQPHFCVCFHQILPFFWTDLAR
jgi:hypothetical protein